jgi:hypothetical protein
MKKTAAISLKKGGGGGVLFPFPKICTGPSQNAKILIFDGATANSGLCTRTGCGR